MGDAFRALPKQLCLERDQTVTSSKQRVMDSIDDCAEDRIRWKDLLHVLAELNGERAGDVMSQAIATNPAFSESKFSSLALLLPQLNLIVERAARMQREYESLAIRSALKADVLNQLSFGVMIVSQCTGIQFTNRAAQEIAAERDGLRICRTRLAADHPEDNSVLAEAQNKALCPHSTESLNCRINSVSVRRRSPRQPYIVDVAPLTHLPLGLERTDNPSILLTINDPDAMSGPTVELLTKSYRLTQTEAAMALKIAKGCSLKSTAEQLAISEQTARWHLKNVLKKTGARRQSELVRLLMGMTTPHRRRCMKSG